MRTLAACLALLSCADALAENRDWPQEPREVFGIALGAPFPPPTRIGDCPMFDAFRREPLDEGVCVDTRHGFGGDTISLRNVPLPEVSREATVTLRDGRVHSLALQFDPSRHEAARRYLVSRYGEPHRSTDDSRGVILDWKGARISIRLESSRLEFLAT